jgi:hypothetical protein
MSPHLVIEDGLRALGVPVHPPCGSILVLLICLCCLVPHLLLAEPHPDSIEIELKSEIKSAVDRSDRSALIEIRGRIEGLLDEEEPERPWLIRYYAGYVGYRLVTLEEDSARALDHLERALDQVRQSIEAKSDFPEAHALHSLLLGLEIGYRPDKAMSNGMKSGMEIGHARTHDPENPRVLMIDALNVLHRPASFGGGALEALPRMVDAAELFERERKTQDKDPALPDWGADEIHVWLAILYGEIGSEHMVGPELEKALEINPDCGWAKSLLESETEAEE